MNKKQTVFHCAECGLRVLSPIPDEELKNVETRCPKCGKRIFTGVTKRSVAGKSSTTKSTAARKPTAARQSGTAGKSNTGVKPGTTGKSGTGVKSGTAGKSNTGVKPGTAGKSSAARKFITTRKSMVTSNRININQDAPQNKAKTASVSKTNPTKKTNPARPATVHSPTAHPPTSANKIIRVRPKHSSAKTGSVIPANPASSKKDESVRQCPTCGLRLVSPVSQEQLKYTEARCPRCGKKIVGK